MSKTIISKFRGVVAKFPNRIAIEHNEKQISYLELDNLSNVLATYLINSGVEENTVIAIKMKRGINFIVAILAILKTNNAYIPIDIAFPSERINYMLEEAKVSHIITDSDLKNHIEVNEKKFHLSTKTFNSVLINNERMIRENNLAYILFTSGSTGKPKGVMVEHRNVVAYCEAFKNEFLITEIDKVLQQSVCTFDIFIEEVFPALLNGSCVVIADNDIVSNEIALMKYLTSKQVTIISSFPYLLNKLNTVTYTCDSLRIAISGGDVLRAKFVTNLVKHVAVYNTYGPSETTVCTAYYRYDPEQQYEDRIPIGKPILNYDIFLLDENNNKISKEATNAVGEIYISGKGVSRGYLNQPELTNKFFIDKLENRNRYYKSGDLGFYNYNGELEFLRRRDTQVMIEGRRVEVDEVIHCLYKYEPINHATVQALKDEDGYHYLVAYVSSDKPIQCSKIKDYLSRYLVAFMVPEFIIYLKEIPLNLNGKIDKEQLPIPLKEVMI
jgi:amino acid adenylation domain